MWHSIEVSLMLFMDNETQLMDFAPQYKTTYSLYKIVVEYYAYETNTNLNSTQYVRTHGTYQLLGS